MAGYTKLFNSILASTVWSEPNEVRIVWITLMAMAGKDGSVEGSLPGLAVFARLTLEATTAAIARLSAPDQYSRSQEHEGRRIETIDGGWLLVNHAKYRRKMGADDRREYLRLKQAEQRTKKKRQHESQQSSTIVNSVNKNQHNQHNAEAEAEADTKILDPINKLNKKHSGSLEKANGNGNGHHTRALPALPPLVFSPQELKKAETVRNKRFGCQHQPRCATVGPCVKLIAAELRAAHS